MKQLATLFLVLVLALTACTQTSPTDTTEPTQAVTVGVMAPLSGDAAEYGNGVKEGIELARKRLDSPIDLVYEDTQCDGKLSVSAINKLITSDGAEAVIGDICSGATIPAAPIAEQNQIVLLSPTASSPTLTTAGEYFYRVIPSDSLQGAVGAQLAYDAGHRKLAVLYINEDYGVGFNEVLTTEFEKLGGEVVSEQTFNAGATDLKTEITKIKAEDPDAVFIISNSIGSAGIATQQLRELGVDAQIYGTEALKSNDYLAAAGADAEGLIITSVSAGSQDFAELFRAEYNKEPSIFSAQGYDAYMAIANAVNSGATSGAQIKAALDQLSFEGVTGTIDFDANGDVAGNYDVLTVKDGEFVTS